jgi:hypothetical protein
MKETAKLMDKGINESGCNSTSIRIIYTFTFTLLLFILLAL